MFSPAVTRRHAEGGCERPRVPSGCSTKALWVKKHTQRGREFLRWLGAALRGPALRGPALRRLRLKGVADGGGEALAARLLVQQHQVLHVFPSEPPPADLHRHFAPLEDLQRLFGRHGAGGGLVAAVPGAHVHGLAADLAHVALLLRAAGRQPGDVLQRHEHAGQRLFARLHAAAQDLKVVEVGPEAAGRHQLPRHGLVEAVEEGLALRRRLGPRARLLTGRPRSRAVGELVGSTSGSFRVADGVAVCK